MKKLIRSTRRRWHRCFDLFGHFPPGLPGGIIDWQAIKTPQKLILSGSYVRRILFRGSLDPRIDPPIQPGEEEADHTAAPPWETEFAERDDDETTDAAFREAARSAACSIQSARVTLPFVILAMAAICSGRGIRSPYIHFLTAWRVTLPTREAMASSSSFLTRM